MNEQRHDPRKIPASKYRQDTASRMRAAEQRELDNQVIRRIQGGEKEAYRELVLKYQEKIYGVAWSMVQNPEDARYLSHEAFVEAFNSVDEFPMGERSFYTWLWRLTVNKTIDFRRQKGSNYSDKTLPSEEDNLSDLERNVENPEEKILARKRLSERITYAIDQLPLEQKTAIQLRELEGLSYEEIATAMNCREGAVMSRLFYGRKKLQEILKD
jgi:RNA polymerase sigma-70 factor, ECF subfamily